MHVVRGQGTNGLVIRVQFSREVPGFNSLN